MSERREKIGKVQESNGAHIVSTQRVGFLDEPPHYCIYIYTFNEHHHYHHHSVYTSLLDFCLSPLYHPSLSSTNYTYRQSDRIAAERRVFVGFSTLLITPVLQWPRDNCNPSLVSISLAVSFVQSIFLFHDTFVWIEIF